MSLDKYPLVYVEWEDHTSDDSWQLPHDVDDTVLKCCSIGWLYKETNKVLVLIASAMLEDGDNVGDVRKIVKSCITKMKVIRKAKHPRKRVRNNELPQAGEYDIDDNLIGLGCASQNDNAEQGQG